MDYYKKKFDVKKKGKNFFFNLCYTMFAIVVFHRLWVLALVGVVLVTCLDWRRTDLTAAAGEELLHLTLQTTAQSEGGREGRREGWREGC